MRKYHDSDVLKLNGQKLPYSMVDFWRINLSEILFNMTRGSFAEFIVLCCLQENGFDALSQRKTGIDPWDIDGPPIHSKNGDRPSRIEVKCTASVQYHTPDDQIPISLPDSQLKFQIKEAMDIYSGSLERKRNNDLYVFCHYTATTKDDDMFDLENWRFYVMPTFQILEDESLSKQTSISIYRLKLLGIPVQTFDSLYDEIIRVISLISEHYS